MDYCARKRNQVPALHPIQQGSLALSLAVWWRDSAIEEQMATATRMFLDTDDSKAVSTHRDGPVPVDGRSWARVTFPGILDERARIDASLSGLLSQAVNGLLGRSKPLQAVDVVSFPGVFQENHLLTGYKSKRTGGRAPHPGLTANEETTKELVADGVSWPTAAAAVELESVLPARFGVEVVDVDLGRTGTAPVVTSRLVSTTTEAVSMAVDPPESPFVDYLESLDRQNVQYLTRTLIGVADPGTYFVEQQVGHFGPENQALYDDEIADVYQLDSVPGHGDAYPPGALSSNLAVIGDRDWSRWEPKSDLLKPYATQPKAPDESSPAVVGAAQRLVADGCEHARLVGCGEPASDLRAAYDGLAVTPTVRVAQDQVSSVLGLVRNYTPTRWGTSVVPDRGPPSLSVRAELRAASGSDQTVPDSTEYIEGVAAEDASELLPAAAAGVAKTAVAGLRAHGATIHATDDMPGPSVVARQRGEGEFEPVLIGTKETLSTGEIRSVVLEAIPDHGVTIVTDDERAADWVLGVVEQPFGSFTDGWTCLDGHPSCAWLLENGIAVVPRDASVRWETRYDGTLRIRVNGETVATGSRSAPPRDCTSPVYRLVPEGRGYTIATAAKEYHEGVAKVSDLSDAYAPIPAPVYPSQMNLLPWVSVFETSDGVLTPVRPTLQTPVHDQVSEWSVPFVGNSRWERVCRQALKKYLYRVPGQTLRFESVTQLLKTYLETRTMYDVPSDDRFADLFTEADSLPTPHRRDGSDSDLVLPDAARKLSVGFDRGCFPGRRTASSELHAIARHL